MRYGGGGEGGGVEGGGKSLNYLRCLNKGIAHLTGASDTHL